MSFSSSLRWTGRELSGGSTQGQQQKPCCLRSPCPKAAWMPVEVHICTCSLSVASFLRVWGQAMPCARLLAPVWPNTVSCRPTIAAGVSCSPAASAIPKIKPCSEGGRVKISYPSQTRGCRQISGCNRLMEMS